MATTKKTDQAPAPVVEMIAYGEVDGKAVQLDRLALDKDFQRQVKKEETGLGILLQLALDTYWSNIHLDPRVVDAEGNQFKNWGLWYADRIKGYELVKEVFTKEFLKKLLVKESVRSVAAATNWSRGYIHDVNQELQGKPTAAQKRAAKKEADKKAADEAVTSPAEQGASPEQVASPEQSNSPSGLVDAAVSAIDAVIAVIANLSPEDLARFGGKVAEAHTAAEAMTGINEVEVEVNVVKVAPKPGPRANGKAAAVVA
jgi:hypothetical protein